MIDVVAEQPVDQIGDVLVLREEDVAADVVAEAVLPEGPAQPAWHRLLLQHLARVPEETLQRESTDAAAENPDVHHSLLVTAFKRTAPSEFA